jgi:hypothetical protein
MHVLVLWWIFMVKVNNHLPVHSTIHPMTTEWIDINTMVDPSQTSTPTVHSHT